MSLDDEISKLPREVLEKAIKLKNATRLIYIKLYCCDKSMTPKMLAEMLGYARPYVHMRLRQLEQLGFVTSKRIERNVFFEVKK